MAQMVKNLPAMWETWVRSLGWEDPLVPGSSPGGSREFEGGLSQRLRKDYLIRKERLGKNSVVGKLVENRG